ncbi:MAG: hypothetical protein LBC76_01680 [Treponema sp.]|jgi:hypothetical protein|nr:hypothetical protein [Treponema sp.]
MTLYLICDISGSMSEGGKCFITRGMARTIEQYFRLGYGKGEIKLIAWSNEARIVEWVSDNEYPEEMLDCKGAANAKALIELLGEQIDGKVLLFTDGFWTRNDETDLKRWKRKLMPDTLRVIKIGADASLKGKDVFSAEDLFAALDGWN